MVRIHPDPPTSRPRPIQWGAIAQLGERLLCKQEVTGSIPVGSTSLARMQRRAARLRGAFSHRLFFNNSEEAR